MSRKISYQTVKSLFQDRGYEMITPCSEYKNSTTKVQFKCPRHPELELWISYHKLKSGNGCKKCGRERVDGSRRTPFEKIKQEFEKRGYTLQSTEYLNSNSLLVYNCNKHPKKIRKITWGNFYHKKKGCRDCANERKAKKRQGIMFAVAKKAFEDSGLELLEKEYINAKTPMLFFCPEHGESKMTYDSVRNSGCRKCADSANSERQRLPYKVVKELCLAKGFELIDSHYLNAHQALEFRCLKHAGVVLRSVNNILYSGDKGCPKCGYEKISAKQKENFARGIVNITLTNNPNYKGGTTDLNRFLRERDKLWKEQSLTAFDYTCIISGEKGGKLEVHHGIPFHEIRDKVLKELNLALKDRIGKYEPWELEAIEKKYNGFLVGVEGFPMKKELHKLFHTIYGKSQNNIEQVWEFKARYERGEFKTN